MSRFWSSLARELTPYVPGSSRASPISSSSTPTKARSVLRRARWRRSAPRRPRRFGSTRTQPRPRCARRWPRYHGVTPDQVFVANGSDEALAFAFAALLKHETPLLFPDVTYSFYPVYCRLFGIAAKPCRSTSRCASTSPTIAAPAGRSFSPIRMRQPGSRWRAAKSPSCSPIIPISRS